MKRLRRFALLVCVSIVLVSCPVIEVGNLAGGGSSSGNGVPDPDQDSLLALPKRSVYYIREEFIPQSDLSVLINRKNGQVVSVPISDVAISIVEDPSLPQNEAETATPIPPPRTNTTSLE